MSKSERIDPFFLNVLEFQEIAAEADRIRAKWPDWRSVSAEALEPLVQIPVAKLVTWRRCVPISLSDFIVSTH